jgi:predicted PurR-regulated permease PerM
MDAGADTRTGGRGGPRARRFQAWAVAIFVFLILDLWTLRTLWNPVLIGAVLVFLLWPLRKRNGVDRLLLALAGLTGLWILAEARTVVYPVVGGLLLASLLDPVVDAMEARRVPRSLAALVILIPLLGVAALFCLLVLPPVLGQLGKLLAQVPGAIERFYVEVAQPWIERVLPGLQGQPVDFLQPVLDGLRGVAGAVGKGLAGLEAVLQVGFVLVLTPVLGYYLLVDLDRFRAWGLGRVPERARSDVEDAVETFGRILGRYLRGQLLVSLFLAAASSVVFTLLGLPYGLVIGLLTGALNIIPVVGFWISFVLAALACLFADSPLDLMLKVAVAFIALQIIEGHVLSPRILGKQLGVNPGLLLLTMLTLAVFFGILGLILAAPSLAFAGYLLERRRSRRASAGAD